MTDPNVLIIGAGPTGLVLALWLARLGTPVRIIDKTAEPGTTSRALAVQVRTSEFYRQVSLADAVIAGGVKVANLNFWVKGARAVRVPLQRIGEGLSPLPICACLPAGRPRAAADRELGGPRGAGGAANGVPALLARRRRRAGDAPAAGRLRRDLRSRLAAR